MNAEVVVTTAQVVVMNAEVVVTTAQVVVMNAEVVVTTAQVVVMNAEIKVNRADLLNNQQLTTIKYQPTTINYPGFWSKRVACSKAAFSLALLA